MGANMGILPRTEEINAIRDKRQRYMAAGALRRPHRTPCKHP